MRAAQLIAPNQIEVVNVPTPAAGPGELVLKVGAATICGTDTRIYRGKKTKGVRFPSIIGHEFAGEITEIGAGVEGFSIGDRVSVDPVIPCHRCAYCMNGMENVCSNRTAIGYEFNGAFAEYVHIPAAAIASGQVLKLPDHLLWKEAALAEPLACCLNGQSNAQVGLDDVVVILGAGPIGLMHVQLARAAGARRVIISEPHEHRRTMATKAGADATINPSTTDLKAAILGITDGLGADVVIVAIGIPDLASEALHLARKGGRVNLFAGFSAGDKSPLDVNIIHYNELSVTGASALTRQQYHQALQLIASGKIDVGSLVTHEYSLDDINEALATAESGTGIKIAIVP
jgi:L-iditol 2-dehydrogenase